MLNIPKWQREYSWEADEEVRQLLEDIEDFVKSNRSNYVLGSIITYPLRDGAHAVVDGQQRTVTLYTLLVAARDSLESKLNLEFGSISKSPEGFRALHQTVDSVTRRVSLDVEAKISIPVHMEYGGGNQLLKALAIRSQKPEGILTVSQVNISNAYEASKEFLDKGCASAAALGDFIRGVINGTFVVETNVGDQRQALDIFFKMNSRGRDLQDADYLKNFLFQAVEESKFDDLSDKWTEMSKALRSADSTRSKLKTPEFFLRNLAIVDNGEKISGEQGVYVYWEDKFNQDPSEVGIFLEDLKEKAKIFSHIAGNKLIDSKEVNRNMLAADYFKGTQYLPILLAGSHLKNYQYLSELVNFRYLLYLLFRERTQDFESMVPRWAKKVSMLPKAASEEKIADLCSSIPNLTFDKSRIDILRSRLEDLVSSKDDRRIRVVQALVSLSYENDKVDLSEYLKKYKANKRTGFEIDLILNSNLIESTVGKSQSEYREYFGIGNVALVNGPLKHYSNKPPQSKEDLYGNDKSVLTRSLSTAPVPGEKTLNTIAKQIREENASNLYEWDLDRIRLRTQFIIDHFVSLIPTGITS